MEIHTIQLIFSLFNTAMFAMEMKICILMTYFISSYKSTIGRNKMCHVFSKHVLCPNEKGIQGHIERCPLSLLSSFFLFLEVKDKTKTKWILICKSLRSPIQERLVWFWRYNNSRRTFILVWEVFHTPLHWRCVSFSLPQGILENPHIWCQFGENIVVVLLSCCANSVT